MDTELISDGEYRDLNTRKISADTCRHFGYTTGKYHGRPCQIANYHSADGTLVAQKLRFPNKDFLIVGDIKKAGLFGAHRYGSGKMIVITEGEIDALSLAEVQKCKWPVVSIPTGAAGAKKAISKNLDYLSNFESVVLMFDNDDPGKQAAAECAEALGPNRCKIAVLPLKDANEMLQADRTEDLVNAVWRARKYQPEGVLAGTDLLPLVLTEDSSAEAIPYPWDSLNAKTHGLRRSEIVTFTAGTGVGKSAVVRELSYYLGNVAQQNVGLIMLEEASRRTALGLLAIHSSIPLHLPKYRKDVTQDQLTKWFNETLGTNRYFMIDHFGSTEMDKLKNRIRYLVSGCDCKWIILDHLSIVVSGQEDGGDERKVIDKIMTDLAVLVRELDCGLLLVSHLKRPEGKGHENGAETSLAQLRGSAAIGQLSDMVIGVERDQQGDNPNVSTVRVLKNRFSGETGIGAYLVYDGETGRLYETHPDFAKADSDTSEFANETSEKDTKEDF